MTYTELKAAIADYLHRDNLTTQIPTFISLAESYLFRELNVKELQTSVTGTTIAGGYGTLPADFGSVSRITVTHGSWTTNLDYMAVPEVDDTVNPYPKYYSLENNQIRIIGAGADQAYTLFYTPDISPLSATVSTNWILDNANELYLYASCLEAARYLRDAGEISTLSQSVTLALKSAISFAERRGQPSSGSLQIRPRRG
jgi:hypothetical protein